MKKLILLVLITVLTVASVFAVSLLENAISFDVPSKLEMQDGSYLDINNSFFKAAGLSPEDGAIRVVLQQKGLNDYKQEAFNQYCRIIIEVMCDEETVDNDSYRHFINTLSYAEIKELDAEAKAMTQTQNVVVTWYPLEYVDFAGYFATKFAFERQSQTGKANVYVEKYSILAGNVVFNITFSYRVTEKTYFLPAIQEFIKSLRLDLSRIPINKTKRLATGSVTVPGTTITMKWPEDGKLALIDSDKYGRYYQCIYAGEFIMAELSVVRMINRLSEYEKMNEIGVTGISIDSTIKEILKGIGVNSYEITKKLTTYKTIHVEFDFNYMGVDSHGVLLVFFVDDFTLLTYLGIEFGTESSIMDDVFDSIIQLNK